MKNMFKFPTILFCLLTIFSCGQEPAFQTISMSGTVSGDVIANHPGKEVMLIVVKGENVMDLTNADLSDLSASMDEIIEYVSVDRQTLSFDIDLTEKDVAVGDEVAIIAFVDVNDKSSIPFPNKGDFLGFYLGEESINTMKFTYTLHDGKNTGIDIPITREIFDFDATIEGTISGSEMGDVTLVAYAGSTNIEMLDLDMSNLDSDDLNFDDFLGFSQFKKTEEIQSFTLEILPMLPIGKKIPLEDVTIFAIVDTNGNGTPDSGDRIAYIPDENNYPSTITINEGIQKNQHLELLFTIPTPSGYSIPLLGTIEMPDGEYFHKNSPPLYLVVVPMGDLDISALSDFSDISSLISGDDGMKIYPTQIKSSLPPDSGQRFVNFNLDLSRSSFVGGDNVLVAALWDMDNAGDAMPLPTNGDRFGFYVNKDTFQFSITLANEGEATENRIPSLGSDSFKLNRVWYEHDASILYRFAENQPANLNYQMGDKILVAAIQKGGLPLDDVLEARKNPTMDIDYVLGFQQIEIQSNTFNNSFTMNLWPILLEGLVTGPGFHVEDVVLIAVLGMEDLDLSFDGNYTIGHYYKTMGNTNIPTVLPMYFEITDYPGGPDFIPERGIRFFNILKF